MARHTKPVNVEESRSELVKLLENFQNELSNPDLRQKVQALVPVYDLLFDMGSSLIPKEDAPSARDRILFYLKKYPYQIIPGEELMVVSGISEWARRVRELRVQFGWSIISGATAKEMASEEELAVDDVDVNSMRTNDYILIDERQDQKAAYRWNVANVIRKKDAGVRDKILEFLRSNVNVVLTGEELRYVAKDKTEWARRVRELRSEFGWPIVTKNTGRPDLPIGAYLLEEDRQSPEHDRNIPDPLRREVLRRDDYKCQRCGWTHDLWNRSDPRHLELHHVKYHIEGGGQEKDNLRTFCTVCHDTIHRSK